MCPAVPRIIAPLPTLFFPELERLQRAPISEMLGEKLPQQPLVGADSAIVEDDARITGNELAKYLAGIGRQYTPAWSETSATSAQRTTGGMTEQRCRAGIQRCVAFSAHVDGWCEA